MRMPNKSKLVEMVKEFLKSERPQTYRRMLANKELDEIAASRAEAALETYNDLMDLSTDDVRKMNEAEQQTPGLGQTQFLTMRKSQVAELVLAQMLEFPLEQTADKTI